MSGLEWGHLILIVLVLIALFVLKSALGDIRSAIYTPKPSGISISTSGIEIHLAEIRVTLKRIKETLDAIHEFQAKTPEEERSTPKSAAEENAPKSAAFRQGEITLGQLNTELGLIATDAIHEFQAKTPEEERSAPKIAVEGNAPRIAAFRRGEITLGQLNTGLGLIATDRDLASEDDPESGSGV